MPTVSQLQAKKEENRNYIYILSFCVLQARQGENLKTIVLRDNFSKSFRRYIKIAHS